MSDIRNTKPNLTKDRKRKAKDIEKQNTANKVTKRAKTTEGDGEKEITENRIVIYNKPKSIDSDEEEQKIEIERIGLDYSSNPLRSYDTFVCHLGNWKNPLKIYLKNPQFRSIFNFVKNQYDLSM